MTTQVELRPASATPEELIVLLTQTSNPRTIEVVAGQLGAAHDQRAVRPLLMRLGDGCVQDDRDAENAVGRALMALGVMGCSDGVSFSLRPRRDLNDGVVATVRELAASIPWRYYGTPRI